jgi:hypothetical protein
MLKDNGNLKQEMQVPTKKEIGNILINRLSSINKKIPLQGMNLPFERFKVKCKMIFLNQMLFECTMMSEQKNLSKQTNKNFKNTFSQKTVQVK